MHAPVPVFDVVAAGELHRVAVGERDEGAEAGLFDRLDLAKLDLPIVAVLVFPVENIRRQDLIQVPRDVTGEAAPELVFDRAVQPWCLRPSAGRPRRKVDADEVAPIQLFASA